MALRKLTTALGAGRAWGVSKHTMARWIKKAGITPYRIDRLENGRKRFWFLESEIEKLQRKNSRDEIFGN